MSDRLQQAIAVGMVIITGPSQATIAAPPNIATMTDDEWLLVLQAASEMIAELRVLGYAVQP